jgi:conjugal transfer/entry exclusion protein
MNNLSAELVSKVLHTHEKRLNNYNDTLNKFSETLERIEAGFSNMQRDINKLSDNTVDYTQRFAQLESVTNTLAKQRDTQSLAESVTDPESVTKPLAIQRDTQSLAESVTDLESVTKIQAIQRGNQVRASQKNQESPGILLHVQDANTPK